MAGNAAAPGHLGGHTGEMGGEFLVGRRDELAVLLDTLAGIGPPYAVLTAGRHGEDERDGGSLLRGGGSAGADPARAPTELDATLGFCVLADLLTPCDENLYDDLPAPQRTAIRAALLREEAPATSTRGRWRWPSAPCWAPWPGSSRWRS